MPEGLSLLYIDVLHAACMAVVNFLLLWLMVMPFHKNVYSYSTYLAD